MRLEKDISIWPSGIVIIDVVSFRVYWESQMFLNMVVSFQIPSSLSSTNVVDVQILEIKNDNAEARSSKRKLSNIYVNRTEVGRSSIKIRLKFPL